MLPYGPAVLRLAVGALFVVQGAQKLFGVWGGGGPAGTAAFMSSLGVSPAYPIAVLVGLVEFIGGLMLVMGGYARVAAGILTVYLGVAAWKVYGPLSAALTAGGLTAGLINTFEHHVVVVAALLSLMLTGAGAFSFDRRRARSAEAEAAGRARLRAGKV